MPKNLPGHWLGTLGANYNLRSNCVLQYHLKPKKKGKLEETCPWWCSGLVVVIAFFDANADGEIRV